MDTSQIKVNEVQTERGIHICKEKSAPIKLMTFINLRCPHCRHWHEKSKEILKEFIEAGKLELIIKHYDKEKETLKAGNVAHRFLDYNHPFEAWNDVDRIFASQDRWGELTLSEVAQYMQDELGLTEQENEENAKEIVEEAKRAHIASVPTIICGDHIFDENISKEELRELLENK